MNLEPSVCSNCGAPLIPGDNICPFCGELVEQTAPAPWPPPPPPSPAPPPPPAGTPVEFAPPAVEAPPIPEAGPSQEQIAAAGTRTPAWEDRRTHGFWASLWITWRESVFRPVEFFRALPPRGGIGPALGFAVLFSLLGLIMNIYWATVQGALAGSQEEGLAVLFVGALMTLIWLAFVLPLYVGVLFAVAGVLHLCFMIVGAGRRGFEATFRAIGYSSGPAAFAIFPFFGPLISLVWGTVVVFIGMREVQRTTNGKTTLAFLLPILAFLLLSMLLGIVLALIFAGVDLGTLE